MRNRNIESNQHRYSRGKIIVPNIFKDKRGYFFESLNRDEFNKKTGIELNFVQENQSKSEFGVVRDYIINCHPLNKEN